MKEKQKPSGDTIPWWRCLAAKVRKWFCAQRRLIAVVEWLRAYWGWVAAVLVVVVVAFAGRDYFACWVGYATLADSELNRGGRFFRDFVVALAAIIGITIAAWRTSALDRRAKTAEDELRLSERRLLSERLTAAMELLVKETKDGKPAISTRVSGIHIMESLAKNAPQEFMEQVIKYLVAYIKGHARQTAEPPLEKDKTPDKPSMLGEDVKAAFVVLHNILGNAAIKAEIGDDVLDSILDFSHKDFSWLKLDKSQVMLQHYKNWTKVDFQGCDLSGADFAEANLSGANLRDTKLHDTIMDGANLTGASLPEDMRCANLKGAVLDGMRLFGTDFSSADMRGVSLSGVAIEHASFSFASLMGVFLRCGFSNTNLSSTRFGDTYMSKCKFANALPEEVRAKMGGNIWYADDDEWAEEIKKRPNEAAWDLSQYEDGYALAGVLRNFANASESPGYGHLIGDFAPDIGKATVSLRLQARKLLDDDKLPPNMPKKWRVWLAQVNPQTGRHPDDDQDELRMKQLRQMFQFSQ